MSLFRVVLVILFPPLSECGSFLIILLLTIYGWILGVIGSFSDIE